MNAGTNSKQSFAPPLFYLISMSIAVISMSVPVIVVVSISIVEYPHIEKRVIRMAWRSHIYAF
jgi:hypothetical protein